MVPHASAVSATVTVTAPATTGTIDAEADICNDDEAACATMLCPEGVEIPGSFICDHMDDCLNGEDEAGCGCEGKPFKALVCSDGTKPGGSRCDGEDDCPDGEDETWEVCKGTWCDAGGVPDEQACDGVDDCENGADEINCDGLICENGE